MNLDERIQRVIADSAPIFEQLPAVVIIHNIRHKHAVYMSKRGLDMLKITLDELKAMGHEYHDRFFNMEDAKEYVPKLFGMLERNTVDETVSFFQQVRASDKDKWSWFMSCIKIFMRDDDGQPLLTITIAIPVDPNDHITNKVERLLVENEFLRKNKNLFVALTKRERQILVLMAKDATSQEISVQLHLSEGTVKTHRRNIKKKLGVLNHYDVVRFAQAFDLV